MKEPIHQNRTGGKDNRFPHPPLIDIKVPSFQTDI